MPTETDIHNRLSIYTAILILFAFQCIIGEILTIKVLMTCEFLLNAHAPMGNISGALWWGVTHPVCARMVSNSSRKNDRLFSYHFRLEYSKLDGELAITFVVPLLPSKIFPLWAPQSYCYTKKPSPIRCTYWSVAVTTPVDGPSVFNL